LVVELARAVVEVAVAGLDVPLGKRALPNKTCAAVQPPTKRTAFACNCELVRNFSWFE